LEDVFGGDGKIVKDMAGVGDTTGVENGAEKGAEATKNGVRNEGEGSLEANRSKTNQTR